VKTVLMVLSLAIAGVAISSGYFDANATRMNGKGSMCSDGSNCMSARYKAATAKSKSKVAKPKTMGN
jgi:hypothetical protein